MTARRGRKDGAPHFAVMKFRSQRSTAMKLNTAQVARTKRQLNIEALPDDHPLVPQLHQIWGDHTYFIDGKGLNIVEPVDAALDVPKSDMGAVGVVVNLANWTD